MNLDQLISKSQTIRIETYRFKDFCGTSESQFEHESNKENAQSSNLVRLDGFNDHDLKSDPIM